MRNNWHVEAERLKAKHPYRPWCGKGGICSLISKRRRAKQTQLPQDQFIAKLEQMKLF